MKGVFISFEGVEGCGKSTQIDMLNDHLKKRGFITLLTREPGGTDIGERIREVLMDSKNTGMSPVAELLLYAASRNQHIYEKITPALEEGTVVLCDRYADATTAYQGAARRLPAKAISDVHQMATSGLKPDITFLLDCPADVGLRRALKRNESDPAMKNMDRFEMEKLDFHERVRSGYLAIAKEEPQRVAVIDATHSIDTMHEAIVRRMDAFLDGR